MFCGYFHHLIIGITVIRLFVMIVLIIGVGILEIFGIFAIIFLWALAILGLAFILVSLTILLFSFICRILRSFIKFIFMNFFSYYF